MNQKRAIGIFLSLMIFLLASGCGGGQAEAEARQEAEKAAESMEDAATQMEEAASKMEEAARKMREGETVEVVDFRKLKEMLPEKLAGMDRKSSEGEKSGGFGMVFSSARATYKSDDNASLEVNIVDSGGVGMVIMGMAAWSQIEVDRETEEGYERTTMVDGFKAFEKYNNKTQSGEMSIIVDSRFIVTVNGRNITEAQLKEAIGGLDVGQLSNLQ